MMETKSGLRLVKTKSWDRLSHEWDKSCQANWAMTKAKLWPRPGPNNQVKLMTKIKLWSKHTISSRNEIGFDHLWCWVDLKSRAQGSTSIPVSGFTWRVDNSSKSISIYSLKLKPYQCAHSLRGTRIYRLLKHFKIQTVSWNRNIFSMTKTRPNTIFFLFDSNVT